MPGVSYDTIAVTTRGPIAEIRLDRADAGNSIDERMLAEIDRAAEAISDDAAIHVVLLTAAGSDFSRGWADGAGSPSGVAGALPFRSLEVMAQPVIACVHGEASGAGLELALACDVRLASEDATFAMPQVAAGGMPWLGGTQRLPRIAGRGAAAALLLLGERFDARQALAYGLVSEVAPVGELASRAEELAQAIASQGPLAVRYAKEAIRQGLDMPLEQALRYETDLTVILQTTSDRAEGVEAFLQKRKPKFEGR
jgi:enoyl-CoA hydratase